MDVWNFLTGMKDKTKVAIVTAVVLLFYDKFTFLHAYEPTQIIAFVLAVFGLADYRDGLRSKANLEAVSSSEQVAK